MTVVGGGKEMTGLSPGVPTSVEPSGTVEPPFNPVVAGAVEDTLPVGLELHELCAVELGIWEPPPSNAEFTGGAVDAVVVQGTAVGLRPPTFNSVTPRGMLSRGAGAFDVIVPNGDVCPMPGVTLDCARLTPSQASQITATRIGNRRIEATALPAPLRDPHYWNTVSLRRARCDCFPALLSAPRFLLSSGLHDQRRRSHAVPVTIGQEPSMFRRHETLNCASSGNARASSPGDVLSGIAHNRLYSPSCAQTSARPP